ncbi:MAG: hypothetical protein U1F68_14855 [Gammaproteobacteria bacterium]
MSINTSVAPANFAGNWDASAILRALADDPAMAVEALERLPTLMVIRAKAKADAEQQKRDEWLCQRHEADIAAQRAADDIW